MNRQLRFTMFVSSSFFFLLAVYSFAYICHSVNKIDCPILTCYQRVLNPKFIHSFIVVYLKALHGFIFSESRESVRLFLRNGDYQD